MGRASSPTTEKRPRHYAAEIMAHPVSEWKGQLEGVPVHLRAMVRRYLELEWESRRGR